MARKYRGRHRKARPAAGCMLAVGAALVAASTAAASAPTAPAEEPSPMAADTPEPGVHEPRGAGGNTPPTASWPTEERTEDRIVHEGPQVAGAVGIPATVLAAYRRAAGLTGLAQPGCRLPMPVLAAIGKVESGHARGGRVGANGRTLHPILGPVLDGAGPFAAIGDTDGGTLDGDAVWDRAVGPMQFIPGTWARWQADGNTDGRTDPHNVYDASLAAARYLCADGRDLGTPSGLDAAILSYNNSTSYLSLVRAWMVVYEDGAVSVTDITDTGGDPAAQAALPPPTTVTPPAGTPTRPPNTTPTPPPIPPPTTTLPPPASSPTRPTPPPQTTPDEPPEQTPPSSTPAEPSEPAQPPASEPAQTGLLCGLLGGLGGLLGLGKPC